jgi:hypothetical protein
LAVFATNLLDKRNVAQISPYPVTSLSPGAYPQYFGPQSVRTVGVRPSRTVVAERLGGRQLAHVRPRR